MIVSMPLCLMGVLFLAVSKRGRIGKATGWSIAIVFLVVTVGFLLALVLPPEDAHSRLWLGLPLRAAIVLYGIGVLPLLVFPLVYAFTFASQTLSNSDIEKVRASRLSEQENIRSSMSRKTERTEELRIH